MRFPSTRGVAMAAIQHGMAFARRNVWSSVAIAMWLFGASGVFAQTKTFPDKPRVAILVFAGVEMLDFAGPLEILSSCRDANQKSQFEVYTVNKSTEAIVSMGAVSIVPTYSLNAAPRPDVLIIPGGNVNPTMEDETTLDWIREQAKDSCLMFSVCNGASILAKLGFLDDRVVTTHHGNFEILQNLAPSIQLKTDRRVIEDGNVITTAGVSAGIDGALFLVAKLKGREIARLSATHAEYDFWPGFQDEQWTFPGLDSSGIRSIVGRSYLDSQTWPVIQLLQTLRVHGKPAALALHAKLKLQATGHQLEMIEESGLSEIAQWLERHSRDPQISRNVFELILSAFPQSSAAHVQLANFYWNHGQRESAKPLLKQSLQLDPANTEAQKLESVWGK